MAFLETHRLSLRRAALGAAAAAALAAGPAAFAQPAPAASAASAPAPCCAAGQDAGASHGPNGHGGYGPHGHGPHGHAHGLHHGGGDPHGHMMPGGRFGDGPGRAGPAGPGGPGLGLWLDGRQWRRALDSVDATPEQRARIRQILVAAREELRAQHEPGRGRHEQALSLLLQPNVDAAAAEQMRQQMLAEHDRVSKRVLQAALDVAQVLTPEQRQQLAERLQQRRTMLEQRQSRPSQQRQAQPRRAAPPAGAASRPAR